VDILRQIGAQIGNPIDDVENDEEHGKQHPGHQVNPPALFPVSVRPQIVPPFLEADKQMGYEGTPPLSAKSFQQIVFQIPEMIKGEILKLTKCFFFIF
jgi:hypothetical protein